MLRTRHNIVSSLIVVALQAVALHSCASKDFGEPIVRDPKSSNTKRIYPQSYGQVWDAVVQVLDGRNMPVISTRKDQGTLATDWISGKSDRLFSGYGDSRIPYQVRYRTTIQIQPTKRGIEVNINNQEQYLMDTIMSGMDFDGSLYRWMETKSSGHKEALILDDIGFVLSAVSTES